MLTALFVISTALANQAAPAAKSDNSVKVAPQAKPQSNQTVNVEGEVLRINADKDVVVKTDKGEINVDVDNKALPVKPGDKIKVTGKYDKELMGNNEVHAMKLTTADGKEHVVRAK